LFLYWDTEDIAKPSIEKIPDEVKPPLHPFLKIRTNSSFILPIVE